MDPHPALLHLYAHVGGRGRRRCQEAHSQAATSGLDPEQSPSAAHQQLPPRLEGRQSSGSPGG